MNNDLREFTFRAVAAGIVFGIVFGAANAYLGLRVGLTVKLALGASSPMPSAQRRTMPLLSKAEPALEIAPALLAVGYILGYRQSAIMVSGSLISALVLTPVIALVGANLTAPLFPEM